MKRINFLNCPVDDVSIPEILLWMENCIISRKPHTIAVVNANKFWLMAREKRLLDYVNISDLVIPEWAVKWGSERLGVSLKNYVRGIAVVQEVIPWAAKKGFRPFFLGAAPETSNALAAQLRRNYPDLNLAGCHHGYLKDKHDQQEVITQIQSSSPDLLFVAMGSPKQEFWITENLIKVNVPVVMGVGGSFDVIAGLKKDTPSWCQGKGLEWIYRTYQNPKVYLKRYIIVNTWFVWQVLKAVNHGSRISGQQARKLE